MSTKYCKSNCPDGQTPYGRWHNVENKCVPERAALEPEELCEILHWFPNARMVVLYQERYVLSDFILCAVMDEMTYEGKPAYWLIAPGWVEGKWIFREEIAGVYWVTDGAK